MREQAQKSCDEIESKKSAFRYWHRDLGLAELSAKSCSTGTARIADAVPTRKTVPSPGKAPKHVQLTV